MPIVLNYLDVVNEGVYNYKCKITNKSDVTVKLAEDGIIESPQFITFEI